MSRAVLVFMLLLSGFPLLFESRGQTANISSGGKYTLEGALGPAPGGKLAGGIYTVDQGSFSLIVETAGAPTMKIQALGADLVITWSAAANAFNLEQTSALGSGWAAVSATQQTANGEIKVTIPFGAQKQFLRLKSANP